MDTYKKIGQRIRERRKQINLSQEKLGFNIGVSRQTISAYESGKRRPDMPTLELIAAGMSIPIDSLLELDNPRADLLAVLRSYGLNPAEVDLVRHYIKYLRQARSKPDTLLPVA